MENNPCMVSVLCTAYNQEEYIARALEGFVTQKTDFPFEVLVNDDKSTDRTADIIREYAEKYPDIIRPFYQAENLYSQDIDIYQKVFFPNARGKYVAYCEGDDYWTDPEKLQIQVDFLESHPEYSACVHNTMLLCLDGAEPDRLLVDRDSDGEIEFEDIIPGMGYAYHTSSLLGKREILANPPDFYYVASEYGFGDYPDALWLRLHGPIRYINRVMSTYCLHSSNGAWSAGVDGQYDKLLRFVHGKVALLKAFRPHAPESILPFLDKYILIRSFDILYTEGRDKELLKPPYNAVLRDKPLSFRIKTLLKCYLPGLQKFYRKARGYEK